MKFSDRIGATNPQTVLNREEMPESLRNLIWQVIYVSNKHLYHTYNSIGVRDINYTKKALISLVWVFFFKKTTDDIPDNFYLTELQLKGYFYVLEWHEVYNYIEFICENIDDKEIKDKIVEQINDMLEFEKSSFRFVGGELAEISSKEEIDEISRAISIDNKYDGVRAHLKQSLELFSKKPVADYRNSIKESISAVESLAKLICNDSKASLTQALKVISEERGMHVALKDGFSKLYGWTSNADGIRHGMLEQSNVGESEARYMLVSCSAFVNYLITLHN